MLLDGKQIAGEVTQRVAAEVARRDKPLTLGILVANTDLPTQKFIAIKKGVAEKLGVTIKELCISPSCETDALSACVGELVQHSDGIVAQLPFASHVDTTTVLNAIPVSHDIDVVSEVAWKKFEKGQFPILPPVVGAIAEICERHEVSLAGKKAVVVGSGRLVGKPAVVWLTQQGAEVTALDAKTSAELKGIHQADILVLGAGISNLITPEMIQAGAVVFDAGTSEAGGRLVGDAHPSCAEKAALFTPVPGGIGPITVAKVFENLVTLAN